MHGLRSSAKQLAPLQRLSDLQTLLVDTGDEADEARAILEVLCQSLTRLRQLNTSGPLDEGKAPPLLLTQLRQLTSLTHHGTDQHNSKYRISQVSLLSRAATGWPRTLCPAFMPWGCYSLERSREAYGFWV